MVVSLHQLFSYDDWAEMHIVSYCIRWFGKYKWKYQIREIVQTTEWIFRIQCYIKCVIQCCAFFSFFVWIKCGRCITAHALHKMYKTLKINRIREWEGVNVSEQEWDSKERTNATPQLYNWFWNLILWCFLQFRDDWMYTLYRIQFFLPFSCCSLCARTKKKNTLRTSNIYGHSNTNDFCDSRFEANKWNKNKYKNKIQFSMTAAYSVEWNLFHSSASLSFNFKSKRSCRYS